MEPQKETVRPSPVPADPLEILLAKPMAVPQDRPVPEFEALLKLPPKTLREKTSALLRRAKERLRGRWVKGALQHGDTVCLLGAIRACKPEYASFGTIGMRRTPEGQALARATRMYGDGDPARYNDTRNTTEDDMLRVMDEAARICEAEGD